MNVESLLTSGPSRRVAATALMRVWCVCAIAGIAPIVLSAEPSTRDMRLRGESATLAGDHAGALAIWEKLVAARPQDVSLLLRLGVSQSILGRYDEAEATLSRALRAQPNNPQLVFNLGLVCFRRGQHGRAQELLERTLALDHRFPEVHYHLGLLCERQGHWDAAKRLYMRELNANPGCSSAWERVFAMRSNSAKREISDVAALVFFAGCMGVSGLVWLAILRRRRRDRDALVAARPNLQA